MAVNEFNWVARIVVLLPLVLLVAWLVARYLGWLPKGRVLSGVAPVGNRVSHRAEAVVLFCVAAAIFVFTATNTSTGGRLLILDRLHPGFAMVNVLAAAAAGLGVLIGALTALFYRTSTGVIVGAGALCIYGMVLNGPETILESLAPDDSAVRDVSLTFTLAVPDAEGAELYVNGVHLGTLPCEIGYDEFHQRVPFWEDEPNELKRGNMRSWLHVPAYWHPAGSRIFHDYPPWAEIAVPNHPPKWNQSPESLKAVGKASTYYARVKLGDEWGYWQIHDGSGSVGGQYGRRTTVVPLGFLFPARQERIETLLDLARLNDYSPDEQWFETIETCRSDGWIAVRQVMDEEPRMSEVLDGWAAWKYDLDAATDSASAWEVFERIRAEANQRQYYMTSDIAGRAVELLAPRLNPDRLVRLTRNVIRSTRLYSWDGWQMNGRLQFGMSYSPRGLRAGADYITGYSAGGRGDERLSPGDYAVAHAVWMLDEALDARDDIQPNIVERELVPAFIARNYDNVTLLRIAARIGGPAIERYLLRQDWQADLEDLPWKERLRPAVGGEVNGWLYLLANLRSPVGRQFRQKNQHALLEMADRLTQHITAFSWERGLDFLFLDLDHGSTSLAMRYWPRFKEVTARETHYALSPQFEYLVRMEPLSTVEMYVQCWKEFRGDEPEFQQALRVFEKMPIPYSKRRAIYDGLVEYIRKDISNVTAAVPTRQDRRDRLISYLTSSLVPITDEARAEDLLAELRAGSSKYTPENVAEWLANGAPMHPLVGMLADAGEPSLRLLVMGALREHPTPANRVILQKLLHDDNEQVRQAAQAVAAELAILKEMPVTELADKEMGPTVQ